MFFKYNSMSCAEFGHRSFKRSSFLSLRMTALELLSWSHRHRWQFYVIKPLPQLNNDYMSFYNYSHSTLGSVRTLKTEKCSSI